MLRQLIATLIFTAAMTAVTPTYAQEAGEPAMTPTIATASVNGVELSYEIRGAGAPLVMLHGGVNPSEMFGQTLADMARTHQVIAIQLRGHGLSSDTDAGWSYEQMADDVAALLAEIGVGKADIMGYSLGAGVAIQTAIRHPDVVGRLVLVSPTVATSAEYPEIRAAFDALPQMAAAIGKNIAGSPIGALYPQRDWEVVMRKTGEMNQPQHDWSADFSRIAGPVLMIFADADTVRPTAIADWYALRGGGQRDAGMDGAGRSPSQLAIVPNQTHYTILTSPVVVAYAEAFLN
ncbi:alpha/beta fold hydrolase [Devosia sp.]|jgi:pimeloyl-ACP methyl ester carboxylesterase|uniref:alpha/beta fold hydrolase n=1 Tax=Devosia sp. TaxID=1871048 RepID=UPI003F726EEE